MIDQINAEQTVLRVAGGLDWVRETQGANRGEVVDRMIRATGLQPPVPWCAAFVAFVGRLVLGTTGTDRWPLKPWAGCQSLHDEAHKLQLLGLTPSPGAIFLLWSDKHQRFNHTGFVDRASDRTLKAWHTIEGNTNEAGHPEGIGVFRRLREFGPKDRFIWWWR